MIGSKQDERQSKQKACQSSPIPPDFKLVYLQQSQPSHGRSHMQSRWPQKSQHTESRNKPCGVKDEGEKRRGAFCVGAFHAGVRLRRRGQSGGAAGVSLLGPDNAMIFLIDS